MGKLAALLWASWSAHAVLWSHLLHVFGESQKRLKRHRKIEKVQKEVTKIVKGYKLHHIKINWRSKSLGLEHDHCLQIPEELPWHRETDLFYIGPSDRTRPVSVNYREDTSAKSTEVFHKIQGHIMRLWLLRSNPWRSIF